MPLFPNPPLPPPLANGLAAGFAGCYVGFLYISQATRVSYSKGQSAGDRQRLETERGRNHPDVIRARLTAAGLATAVSCCICYYVLGLLESELDSGIVAIHTAERLGFASYHPILSHLVAPVLFLGPLYAMYLYEDLPFQSNWSKEKFTRDYVNLIGFRNFVAGPFTEEVVFRACILFAYHLCGASRTKMIFVAPLWFGVAHLHHGWDVYNRLGRTKRALQVAVLQVAFQFIYTTLFGFHCSYLFLRTGSIYPSLTAHVFCNIMGLPMPTSEARAFPRRKSFIFAVYILGILGYIFTITRWTQNDNSLYWLGDEQRSVRGY
ncbi:Abi-domain-containing protein [Cylindrobasidium torrendii FP15055 ss-10]|uniref:intramembrane prenyl-peptidase Rce1 n=1 Tax=Cylindrobasidium torrendii FP15055 ss-10 TaxID=1314674 RepID=A0A0D7BLQ5_9AGAR|nr:Abi-domain-containing protein [Cylindrobasidium torrendii FP15055 ss-10]